MKKLLSVVAVLLCIAVIVPSPIFAAPNNSSESNKVSCRHINIRIVVSGTRETCTKYIKDYAEMCKDCNAFLRYGDKITLKTTPTHTYVYLTTSCNGAVHIYAETCISCRSTTGRTMSLSCNGRNCIEFMSLDADN